MRPPRSSDGLLVWLGCVIVIAGCVGASTTMGLCKRDAITGSPVCQSGGGTYGDFAITAIIAAVLYPIVGCKWNGCPLPDRCNRETKLCEHIPCSETRGCPAGYACALDKHICR